MWGGSRQYSFIKVCDPSGPLKCLKSRVCRDESNLVDSTIKLLTYVSKKYMRQNISSNKNNPRHYIQYLLKRSQYTVLYNKIGDFPALPVHVLMHIGSVKQILRHLFTVKATCKKGHAFSLPFWSRYYQIFIPSKLPLNLKILLCCHKEWISCHQPELQLFDSLILPLMDYSSELWSSKSVVDALDVFHLGYMKRILGVRPSTPTLAVYGELGRQPVSYRLEMNKLKYFHRLCNLPSHSITKKVYNKLFYLHNSGFSTWITRTLNLYEEFEQASNIPINDFCNKSKIQVKNVLKKYELQRFTNKWKEDMNAISSDKKLRTYVLFKSELKMETYLYLNIPKYRFALSRFRCSSHNLQIELGRHTKPRKTELKDRLCKKCCVLGDEIHHVTSCAINKDLRKDLFSKIENHNNNFKNLTNNQKFLYIMQSKESQVIRAFSYFLYKSDLIW